MLGESTFYGVFRLEKAELPSELMVRFEGVPGEFAQFDCGVADVRLFHGRTKRIHFAAHRLKHSRWVRVVTGFTTVFGIAALDYRAGGGRAAPG